MTFCGLFLLLLFVLTVVTQLTSLKEKPDCSQEWHRREVLGYLESPRLNDLNDSYKPLFFDRWPRVPFLMLVLNEASLTVCRGKGLR